ncbi:MAG: 50S ribosomal protein L6 [Anaerolineae bacterium]|nr:50S ribosomal protein L6 [Anaerolineae bacterium]
MSRIGKQLISLPKGVSVETSGFEVMVKGPKGQLTQTIHPDMVVEQEDGTLVVKRPSDNREHRSLHGLTRALVNNMVVGVSDGFSKTLILEGVGYRAEMSGKDLVLNLGYSHPITYVPTQDISFEVEDRGKKVIIKGIDKQAVGQIAAVIRKQRPPEPYKGKGIRYSNETIRRKAGKAGKV